MKKGILLCAFITVSISPLFAEYTLTPEDYTVIKATIEQVQTKPIHTREVVIRALKNAQSKTTFTEQKQAIFAAVESGLREKTSSGDILATSLERKEVIQSLFAQTIEKKTGSATLRVTGDISSSVEPKKTVFDSSFSADVDAREPKNPKVRVRLDGTFEDDIDKMAVTGEMRVVDRVGYIIVEKLSLVPDENDMASFIAPYLNVWIKFPLEDFAVGEMQNTSSIPLQANITTQKILLENNIIPQLLYTGQAGGVSTYNGAVDTDAFIASAIHVLGTQGEVISESDIQEMKETLQGITIQTQLSLDVEKIISDITFTAQIEEKILEDESIINGIVTVQITSSPLPDTILAPEDAQSLDTLIQQEL